MTDTTLTLIDVRHVQTYLFNANELKQNFGASALVEQATHGWIFKFLPPNRNAEWDSKKHQLTFDDRTVEKDNLDAEVVFMGGGNAVILFATSQKSIDFTKNYTEHVMLHAPDLDVAVAHVNDIDLTADGALRKAWEQMHKTELPKQKEGRLLPKPLLGMSVTAECAYTGLPAVAEAPKGQGDNRILLSAQSFVKQTDATVQEAKGRLGASLDIEGFEYPSDFDDLGGEYGSSRFIAVVHADGNGIGKRLKEWAKHDDNREMIRRMREFSTAVNQVGTNAMQAVRDYLALGIHVANDKKRSYEISDRFDPGQFVRLKDNNLPIRPLVYGGDDVTFVCEGRLGLALAAKFLQAFSNADLPDGQKTYACAGVAIVHSHYPFARAYTLAEKLCQDAKRQARLWNPETKEKGTGSRLSLLNWHITTSGLTLDWDEIKKREFKDGRLLLRPLVVAKADETEAPAWQTWDTFTEQVSGFRSGVWQTQRNKQKDLREVLRKGSEQTQKFTNQNGNLPRVASAPSDASHTGWIEEQCLYFDALEALDVFVYPKEMA
jgi:hypothetical protein